MKIVDSLYHLGNIAELALKIYSNMHNLDQQKWRILKIFGIGVLTLYDAYSVYNDYYYNDNEGGYKNLIGLAMGAPLTATLICKVLLGEEINDFLNDLEAVIAL